MVATKKPTKILIADTQFLTAEALKSLLLPDERYTFVGWAEDKKTLRMFLRDQEVDVLITDCNNFEYNGATTLAELVAENPGLCILILTHQLTRNELMELNKTGIKNILLKTACKEEMLSAIEATAHKKKYYGQEVLDLLMSQSPEKTQGENQGILTPSEIGIVKLIACGLTTKEIAQRKNISFHTVMSHRKNIFRKLGINNASELVMQAVRNGWTDPIEYYI